LGCPPPGGARRCAAARRRPLPNASFARVGGESVAVTVVVVVVVAVAVTVAATAKASRTRTRTRSRTRSRILGLLGSSIVPACSAGSRGCARAARDARCARALDPPCARCLGARAFAWLRGISLGASHREPGAVARSGDETAVFG